jgi:hypothetical protein
VQNFVKEHTDGYRIRTEAVKLLGKSLDQIALALVKHAHQLALQAPHPLIEREDIQAAYAATVGGASDPTGVFSSIDKLDTEELTALVHRVTDWLKERQSNRRP